ncbi:hypothetical protein Ancab_012575 [Ancistrocladus abbreviatus]
MKMEMQRDLHEAAIAGDVHTLNALIQKDPLILDRITYLTFSDQTPLHIAAVIGHSDFAASILTHSPGLASESDSLGRTPLHAAAIEGRVGVARELLRVNSDACLVRDKEGNIPLHLAVMEGRIEVASELARTRPESAQVGLGFDGCGGSVLHLCVKFNCLEALKVLIEAVNDENFLNLKDEDGNTILHLAVMFKRFEITEYLLSVSGVVSNALNGNDFTALDLMENSPTRDFKTLQILNILLLSGAQRARDLNPSTYHLPETGTSLPPKSTTVQQLEPNSRADVNGSHGLEHLRGALILTASIIAAATFIPPSNWDETHYFSLNAASLVLSFAVVLLLTSGFPLNNKLCAWIVMSIMFATLYCMAFNFMSTTSSYEDRGSFVLAVVLVLLVWCPLLGLVWLVRTVKLIIWLRRKIREFIKNRRPPTYPPMQESSEVA